MSSARVPVPTDTPVPPSNTLFPTNTDEFLLRLATQVIASRARLEKTLTALKEELDKERHRHDEHIRGLFLQRSKHLNRVWKEGDGSPLTAIRLTAINQEIDAGVGVMRYIENDIAEKMRRLEPKIDVLNEAILKASTEGKSGVRGESGGFIVPLQLIQR